ncbi:Glycosyltransferase involved in cell wall bisynthesis [Jhaorihella thermophila]|uniref:Glycosyltransferase involved in cell wall bisynthesis n=2 Tax=Jhaorihella thermophila TaxID=488547 RepID=A0A1H5Y7X1_9RHOB|nr:Glycosyltransferase involved in cell wall bisynthesis [Jhaorihella thermophila]
MAVTAGRDGAVKAGFPALFFSSEHGHKTRVRNRIERLVAPRLAIPREESALEPRDVLQNLPRQRKAMVFLVLDLLLVPVALGLALIVQALPVPAGRILRDMLPVWPVLLAVGGGLSAWLGLPRIALKEYGHRAMALTGALAAGLAVTAAAGAALAGVPVPAGTWVVFGTLYLLVSVGTRIGLFHLVTALYQRETHPGRSGQGSGAAPSPSPWRRLDCAVTPGTEYVVQARFAGPFVSRRALARVAFEDAGGNPVPPPAGTPHSDAVGHYRYLETDGASAEAGARLNTGLTGFAAPPGAARMHVDLLPWAGGDSLVLEAAEIHPHDGAQGRVATGELELPRGAGHVALTGALIAGDRAEEPLARLRLRFFDRSGQPIIATAEGLRRDGFHDNTAIIAADPLGPRDDRGTHPLRVRFRPPTGTQRLIWSLYPAEEGADVRLDGALSVAVLNGASAAPGTGGARLRAASGATSAPDEDQIARLRARLPQDPAWITIARRGDAVLAEIALTVVPEEWVTIEARLSRDAGRLDRARLFLLPVFFDAADGLLEADIPGCSSSSALGRHRLVTPMPEDDRATQARLSEPFRAPEGAARALFYLVANHVDPGIRLEGLTARPAAPHTLFDAIDISRMDRARLVQAETIARAVWDLPAWRTISRALGVMGGDRAADRLRRAEALTGQLTELDTGWLPELPPQPPLDADPRTVLHLLKVICPEEGSGGAVRSTSILESQAASGLRPVACLPLAAPRGDMAGRPDGIVSLERNGVSVNFLNFSALDPRALPATDLLRFETALHNRVLRAHRASLIHAASGFRGYENALKGLALAQANGLPMVYEVRSFHEHTWRPVSATHLGDGLTRLRMAQEDRCMAAADAVVTISRAMETNLRERGVPADRLFVVPNAIGPTFETLCPMQEADALRARHGFAGPVTVGYISNFSLREGHRVLLEAFARLVAAGHDLHLVMVGDGPERPKLAEEVRQRRLGDRVTMPGPVDHGEIRAWYRAIDLFIVPRIADFASDYVTPLKPFEAMSQQVPVLMSDRPVAREIAGEREERAGIFPSGDAEALAGAIAAALADRSALAARAAAARDWVLRERVWASVARRYDAVYATARDIHAQRNAVRRAG